MADQRDDPIAAANQHIRDYIRGIGGRIITVEQRAKYEQLVQAYMDAVREREETRTAESEAVPLAA